MNYDFKTIESRWQSQWEKEQTFTAHNPGHPDFQLEKPKFYVLDMFPYPSGVGLHVGHPLGFIATDITARYKKMQGYNVLHSMGFDAFGLPAEQHAIKTGEHPRICTQQNINNMIGQLKRLGMGYDWDRSFATTDEDYVKWTQWIFIQLYNSYFDPEEQKALPIQMLKNKLMQEEYFIDTDGQLVTPSKQQRALAALASSPIGYIKFAELEKDQQQRLIDENRLAFLAEVNVNWCPGLGTVLANEEVTNEGKSERDNHPVYKRPLKQWMLRITAYSDRLINDLDIIDWPESIKHLQRNWIGKSVGASVDFDLESIDEIIAVFTTRPDTLFGATYMVLAPEHAAVKDITTPEQADAIAAYQKQAAAKTDIDRSADSKDKTGVFTGGYAINPVNGKKIPVWISDYVMMSYGTGAIMAVPAHDSRDYAFAKKFDLPIVQVIQGGDITKEAHAGNGKLINSSNNEISLDGLEVKESKEAIITWLESKNLGRAKTQYKLRDWLFSRQRYWGEPFPILHGEDGSIRTVPEADLPVVLPELDDYKPTTLDDPTTPPQPPLARADDAWKNVTIDGIKYTREFNTMPNWAGSCWYYLRYMDPKNNHALVGEEAINYWMKSKKSNGQDHAGGIDLYVGGAEHAVLHLLYARFWHKFLFDIGAVNTPEPFGKYFAQGYIQAFYYEDQQGVRVEATQVVNSDGTPASELQDKKDAELNLTFQGRPVKRLYGKMGKSLHNAVAPDAICQTYGCDTLRLYEMYMGPLDQSKTWNTRDIVGSHRFLQRVWRNFFDEQGQLKITDEKPSPELHKKIHHTIKRVTTAMQTMSFNIAIAALIELNNRLVKLQTLPRQAAETLLLLLAPQAPHIAEELWQKIGHDQFIANQPWPEYDPAVLVEAQVQYPVQVNGKLRAKITVDAQADDQSIQAIAKEQEGVIEAIGEKTIKKIIIIKGRMINIVVG